MGECGVGLLVTSQAPETAPWTSYLYILVADARVEIYTPAKRRDRIGARGGRGL